MVNLIEIEIIVFSVKQDFAIVIGFKFDFFYSITFAILVKVKSWIFSKNLKSDAGKLFVCIITINFYDLERCLCSFAFISNSIFLFAYDLFIISVYRDLIGNR